MFTILLVLNSYLNYRINYEYYFSYNCNSFDCLIFQRKLRTLMKVLCVYACYLPRPNLENMYIPTRKRFHVS